MFNFKLILFTGVATAAFIAVSTDIYAQEDIESDAAVTDEKQSDNEGIIVTARRREERLQEIPESITTFSAEQIERAGISNFRDVANLTPNLSQLENFRPGLARIQIRGLITPQVGDPPIAFVVDGITASDLEFINQELFDIERIEVLRGAQGALYGRGAIGGAINIVTKKPTNDFEASATTSFASGNDFRVSGLLSGPIVKDKILFRAGAYYRNFDGQIENSFLNENVDFQEEASVFGLLSFQLGANTGLDIRGRYTNTEAGLGYYQNVSADNFEDFSIDVSQNILGVDNRDVYEINAKLEHAFDFATFELVAGYSESDQNAFSDGDFSAVPSDFIFHFAAGQENILAVQSYTVETRLTSNSDGRFRWALGGFYQDRRRESVFNSFDDAIGDAALVRSDFTDADIVFSILDNNDSEVFALSGQFNFDITDALELTGALRYDQDARQSVDIRDIDGSFVEDTFSELQPKISLAYQATPDLLFYGGYSRGFRSGGFNEFSPIIERIFPKETSDSFELGFKSTIFDGIATLNGAIFQIDQDDAQITRFNIDSFTLENTPIDAARSRGFELEFAANPTDQLTISIGGGVIDSEIRSFSIDPSIVGVSLPYVSDYNINGALEYAIPLANSFDLVLRGDIQHVGPRIFNLELADIESSAQTSVNLRATLESENWSLTAFADNLFNNRQVEDLFLFGDGVTDLARFPNREGRIGIKAKISF